MYLTAEAVTKRFGGAMALDNVGISLDKGEVHALVGANGAGKSTLAKIIAGHLRPDHAELRIDDAPVTVRSPRDAMHHGVAMVTQQLSLAADLSVAENIMLADLSRPGRLNRTRLFETAERVLLDVNPQGGIDLHATAGGLSSAHRQMVEIAKAVSQNPRIIIFDEPTTSLTPFEVESLFEVMDHLTRQDKGLVFVSHRLEEIFTICNRVTVLRDGRNICRSVPIADLNQAELIRLMIGRDVGASIYARQPGDEAQTATPLPEEISPDAEDSAREGEVVLSVRNLCAPPMVKDVSFTLRRGEILGLAGLVGAGRTETARVIFGLDPMKSGEIQLHGEPYVPRSPRHAYRRGMAMIPEDRKTQGIITDFLVRENIMISHSAAFSKIGTGYAALLPKVLAIIERLRLAPPNLDKYMGELSGGMQQKAMLSRALIVSPGILILDEPTQGVDVGTRSDIYAILRDLAAHGMAVLFISSDFEEVLGVCDRIVVLTEGRSSAKVDAALVDEEKLTMFAAPRTSARSTNALIDDLVRQWPVLNGYWVYLDQGRVYCFNRINGETSLPLGFEAGEVAPRDRTCLMDCGPAEGGEDGTARWFTRNGLSTLLIERHNARGQKLGYVGLTVPEAQRGALDETRLAALLASCE